MERTKECIYAIKVFLRKWLNCPSSHGWISPMSASTHQVKTWEHEKTCTCLDQGCLDSYTTPWSTIWVMKQIMGQISMEPVNPLLQTVTHPNLDNPPKSTRPQYSVILVILTETVQFQCPPKPLTNTGRESLQAFAGGNLCREGLFKTSRLKKENKKARGRDFNEGKEVYSLVTLLSPSQVTWNHVHGFTNVGSQLCRTFPGSFKALLKA